MMRFLHGWRRRDHIALALSAFFLLVLAIEWMADGMFHTRTVPPAHQTPSDAAPPAPTMPRLDQGYAIVAERPLFMETRRPYVPPPMATPAGTAAAPPEPLTLLATVLMEGRQIALIQSQRDNRIQMLSQGEALAGWTLVDVQPGFVLLRRGNDNRRLDLVVKPGDRTRNASPQKTGEQ